jgi:hypothetical protein
MVSVRSSGAAAFGPRGRTWAARGRGLSAWAGFVRVDAIVLITHAGNFV